LEKAVVAFREALKIQTRDRVPLQWASTQNSLGNPLRSLGERETGTKMLEQAIETYAEALEVRTWKRVPLDWAATTGKVSR
jgi:hypothetical protein